MKYVTHFFHACVTWLVRKLSNCFSHCTAGILFVCFHSLWSCSVWQHKHLIYFPSLFFTYIYSIVASQCLNLAFLFTRALEQRFNLFFCYVRCTENTCQAPEMGLSWPSRSSASSIDVTENGAEDADTAASNKRHTYKHIYLLLKWLLGVSWVSLRQHLFKNTIQKLLDLLHSEAACATLSEVYICTDMNLNYCKGRCSKNRECHIL